MTWLEASAVFNEGDCVRFVYPQGPIPEGTTGTVVCNGLNELHCVLEVRPDDARLREGFAAWDGCIYLGTHLDPIMGPEKAGAWHDTCPVTLVSP